MLLSHRVLYRPMTEVEPSEGNEGKYADFRDVPYATFWIVIFRE